MIFSYLKTAILIAHWVIRIDVSALEHLNLQPNDGEVKRSDYL